jgi:hypothetical protein
LVLTVLVAVGMPSTPAAPAERAAPPSAAVSPAQTAPGQRVLVSGNGWPASSQIAVEVCGEEGRYGSSDCDLQSSTVVGSDPSGAFGTQITVQIPPKPCPCVVHVSSLSHGKSLVVPIEIVGAPMVALAPETPSTPIQPITIERMELTGGSWPAWLAWPAQRTLVLTLRNTSGDSIDELQVLVATGRESNPDDPQPAPRQKPLGPGEVRTIRVPVAFGAPSIGTYGVRIRVVADGVTTTRRLTTSTYPWGIFAIAVVLFALVVFFLVKRVRRRAEHRSDPGTPGELCRALPESELVP